MGIDGESHHTWWRLRGSARNVHLPNCSLISAQKGNPMTLASRARKLSACSLWLVPVVLIAILLIPGRAWSQVSVLTQHNDIGRSGDNSQETTLTTANVNINTFGKLFTLPVDGQIYAQPLYMQGVNILGLGPLHNILYVATSHNKVYAFDADGGNGGKPYWTADLGPFVPSSVIETVNILEGVGIIGTPVIDSTTGLMYVADKTYNAAKAVQTYHLHALDITTGKDMLGGPVVIKASVQGKGYGSTVGTVAFDATHQLNRPGLLLLNGTVYLGFGSHEDYDPYHGWLVAYDAATLQHVGTYCTTPNGARGAIWQGGNGIVSDGESVYVMTANGDTDIEAGGKESSECFLRLKLAKPGDLVLEDWFLVHDFQNLNDYDIDLGSGGPILLPGTDLIAGGGKEGILFVTNTKKLGKWGGSTSADPQIQQEFQAWYGNLMGAPVIWNSTADGLLLYVWSTSDVLRCYQFDSATQTFNTTPFGLGQIQNPGGNSAPGALSISSNGAVPGSTVLWATTPASDPNSNLVAGTLRAFDPTNIGAELYDSNMVPRDTLGNWGKFCPPTVANGKVYVGTSSDEVAVYGLLPAPLAPSRLSGIPGDRTAALTWGPSTYATTYTVERSTSAAGTFSPVAEGIKGLQYADSGLANGTTYYYEVLGVNNAGSSEPSRVIDVTPYLNADRGTEININFVGGGPNGDPLPMEPAEQAGVAPSANWNNCPGPGGEAYNLLEDTGAASMTSLAWSSQSIWSIPITDTPGNFRMMEGYLDCYPGDSTTITVIDLPTQFVTNGYKVYVYYSGDTNEKREGVYAIGATKIDAVDLPNAPFAGTFTQSIAGSAGNYIVFPSLSIAGFTLTATPLAVGAQPRAPINGIQIVENTGG
jgi:hypothetical protein